MTGRRRGSPRVLVTFRTPSATANPFLTLFSGSIAEHVRLSHFTWPRALFARYDVLHMHWPEDMVRGKNKLHTLVAGIFGALLLAKLAVRRTPVVWTVHNLEPHEARNPMESWFVTRMNRRVGLRLYLNESDENPAEHPTLLHGDYADWLAAGGYSSDPESGRLLYFGLLRPYKGVEDLLAAFGESQRDDWTLVAAGKPADARYVRTLEALAAGAGTVALKAGFLPDRELRSNLAAAELVVLPYKRMYNSGSALLALSAGKPVLVPRTPSTTTLQREVGAEWVTLFDAPISADDLQNAIRSARQVRAGAPDLRRRDWSQIGSLHGALYERVVVESSARGAWPPRVRAWVASDARFLAHSERNLPVDSAASASPASGSLGRAAARGGLATGAGQLLRIALQFAGIVTLARLLLPADYGLLAMVVAIVGVGEVFRDFGLSTAAVQAASLTKAQKDNLFWINTGVGAILAVAVFFAAPLIVALYHEPRLYGLVHLLSLTFLINGLSTQFRAQLNRDMKFARLASVDVGSAALGLAVAITLALLGAGYWALGAQQVVVAGAGLVLSVATARWLPGLFHRRVGILPLVKFGANLMGVQLLNYASKNIDSVLIGTRIGATQLGFYDRAFQILTLPLNQLNAPATKVALPVLSRLQDDRARFTDFIIRGQSIMVQALCAVFGFAAAQAPWIVPLVLGERWQSSSAIFQILALGGAAQAVSYATYWVFLSKGLASSNLRFALATRPLLIALIVGGSFFGVLGVAAGYSLGLLLLWPIGLWWISRVSDAPAAAMFRNGLRAIACYGLAGAASFGASSIVAPASPPLLTVAIGTAAFATGVGVLATVVPQFRRDIVDIGRTARLLRPGS